MRNMLIDWLAILCRPGYWLQNDQLSLDWDRELTWLLDNGYHFEPVNGYESRIGNYTVWTENHPYASFTLNKLRPHRITILRAYRCWVADGCHIDRSRVAETQALIAANQAQRSGGLESR